MVLPIATISVQMILTRLSRESVVAGHRMVTIQTVTVSRIVRTIARVRLIRVKKIQMATALGMLVREIQTLTASLMIRTTVWMCRMQIR